MASDMMIFFFVFDDYTDGLDAPLARECGNIVMDAIQNPNKPRPIGEMVIGYLAQQCVLKSVSTQSLTTTIEDFGH
jgi:hypothetical protein